MITPQIRLFALDLSRFGHESGHNHALDGLRFTQGLSEMDFAISRSPRISGLDRMSGVDRKKKDRAESAEEIQLSGQQCGCDLFRPGNPGSDHSAPRMVDRGEEAKQVSVFVPIS